MSPPFEIRLYAYHRDDAGMYTIVDIVETSRRYAPFFARRFYRIADITHIAAVSPSSSITIDRVSPREIVRT